ncbi:histidine kinase [Streptomyces sp. NBC_01283]|uniref:sensor histidine kinase n=1 Tax=Streptomyces sp. NBC_01283 TaxID=2903812 RepID=UPI00352DB512|nr:histidine kinase [Streptomyces sp. NBC_01283]
MVGRIQGLKRGWHERSKIEKVEFQSMAMWHAMPWVFLVSWGSVPLLVAVRHGPLPLALGCSLLLTAVLQCVHVNRTMRRSLDHFLKRAQPPRRDLAVSLALMVTTLGLVVALQAVRGVEAEMLTLATMFAVMPYGQSLAFAVPIRTFFIRFAVIGAATVAAFAAIGVHDGRLVGTAVVITLGTLVSLLSSRCGAWTLAVMWEADRAREVEARLAVAEERLRFGRDLHDVMGRNLAVIALKSELAVQLARRGRPEAVDQMVEVQRIAQESQREVREVVRGYREADLAVELAGAQGVLEAAGIDCRVTGSSAGLSVPVQSALGWVVREATTNVLRHGDARRCDITLTITDERTSLAVENDGVPEAAPEGRKGSGLAGLRERLAAVDGTLDLTSGEGRFRLVAEVPLARPRQDERDPNESRQGDRHHQEEAERVTR